MVVPFVLTKHLSVAAIVEVVEAAAVVTVAVVATVVVAVAAEVTVVEADTVRHITFYLQHDTNLQKAAAAEETMTRVDAQVAVRGPLLKPSFFCIS